jgi:hypothetical protein
MPCLTQSMAQPYHLCHITTIANDTLRAVTKFLH